MDRVLRRAARLVPAPPPGNLLDDLRCGVPEDLAAARRGLPEATVRGVASFYDHLDAAPRVCDGTACHFAHRPELPGAVAIRCVGRCYDAPAAILDGATWSGAALAAVLNGSTPPPDRAIPVRTLVQPAQIVARIMRHEVGPLEDLPPAEELLARVEAAGLRGRGGAAFPTAAKWKAARAAPGPEKAVVVNGDEGDPGSYVDRLLLERDPHAVLAGLRACAAVIGATRGYVYIRAEYPEAQAHMRVAIRAEAARGLLTIPVEVVSGAGSYVCGEESALLRSIEGRRGEPVPKPPYPTERGLFGWPTVVQNVETLAMVAHLATVGDLARSKLFCLSGAVAEPGVVEAPLGIPLAHLVERCGGFRGTPRFALVGGPMGRVLAAREFDARLDFATLPGMGHGGIVILDDTTSAGDLARHLYAFARAESCGACAPCRIGTAQLPSRRTRASLDRLLTTLEQGSLCGFGQGVPRPIRDLLRIAGPEVFA